MHPQGHVPDTIFYRIYRQLTLQGILEVQKHLHISFLHLDNDCCTWQFPSEPQKSGLIQGNPGIDIRIL